MAGNKQSLTSSLAAQSEPVIAVASTSSAPASTVVPSAPASTVVPSAPAASSTPSTCSTITLGSNRTRIDERICNLPGYCQDNGTTIAGASEPATNRPITRSMTPVNVGANRSTQRRRTYPVLSCLDAVSPRTTKSGTPGYAAKIGKRRIGAVTESPCEFPKIYSKAMDQCKECRRVMCCPKHKIGHIERSHPRICSPAPNTPAVKMWASNALPPDLVITSIQPLGITTYRIEHHSSTASALKNDSTQTDSTLLTSKISGTLHDSWPITEQCESLLNTKQPSALRTTSNEENFQQSIERPGYSGKISFNNEVNVLHYSESNDSNLDSSDSESNSRPNLAYITAECNTSDLAYFTAEIEDSAIDPTSISDVPSVATTERQVQYDGAMIEKRIYNFFVRTTPAVATELKLLNQPSTSTHPSSESGKRIRSPNDGEGRSSKRSCPSSTAEAGSLSQ